MWRHFGCWRHHVSVMTGYDVISSSSATSQNQKSEISRLKIFQMTLYLDTSSKIVRQTFPGSLTKIWRTDVTWRHFMTSCEIGGAILPPLTYIQQSRRKFSPIHPNASIFSVNMHNWIIIKVAKARAFSPSQFCKILIFLIGGAILPPLARNRVKVSNGE